LDLANAKLTRIRTVLDNWTALGVGMDRRWLEPLLDTFGGFSTISSHSPYYRPTVALLHSTRLKTRCPEAG
jgi:hypothetical protein